MDIRILKICISYFTLVLAGCDSGMNIDVLSKESPASPNSVTISRVKPFVVGPNGTVTTFGTGFKDGMTVIIDGVTISMEVVSEENATFVTPSNLKAGRISALVKSNGETVPIALYGLLRDEHPLITLRPSEVCSGVQYYDDSGNFAEGTKDCQSSVPTCSAQGEVGCAATSNFKAGDISTLSATDIKSGVDIAGITGSAIFETHRDCSSDGTIGCAATAGFKAADITLVTPGKVRSGIIIAGVSGSYPSAAYPLPGADATADLTGATFNAQAKSVAGFEYWDSSGERHLGAGDSDIVAANIADNIDVLGTTGTTNLEVHSSCSGNSQQDCLTTATYQSADLSNLSAGSIKNGVTIAGVLGDYPSASNPLIGANATADLTSATFNAKLQTSVAFEYFDSAGNRYTGAGDTDLVVANIVSGTGIFGVVGTGIVESHSNCTGNSQQGCLTTTTYKSADLANLLAGNVKNGVTIAGVAGDYPSATSPLVGADATADLTSATFNTKLGNAATFEYFDSVGNRYTGTGDTDLAAVKVANGTGIFGVTGTSTIESHSDCVGNGQQGCLATATYQSADLTNLAASNVKSGVTIAGVAGDYPSASNPLTGADGLADLTSTTFANQLQAATSFEYFDSAGNRYTGAGDTDFAAINITSGTGIFGLTGTSPVESHISCTGNAQQGCIVTATYQSADLTNLSADNVKNGVTIADVVGDYPSATNQLVGADATDDLTSATFNAKLETATAFEYFDSVGNRYTGAGDADLAAAKVVNGSSIFGVTGTATVESHINCTGNAQQSCLTTATYQSMNMTNLSPGNVKNGITIAGVTGNYPSVTSPLAGAQGGTADLISVTFDAQLQSAIAFEYFDSAGNRYSDAGDTDLAVAKIISGVEIFGVTGTAPIETHSNCTGNGQQGCAATATFQSADLTNLSAANVKNGVNIAGTNGTYPSATNRLPGAQGGTADLDSATFNAQAKSVASFEYWDSAGTRHTGAGDIDITGPNLVSTVSIFGTSGTVVIPADCSIDGSVGCVTTSQYKAADTNAYTEWDVKLGKTVGGKAGEIAFFRNAADTSFFDRITGTGAVTGLDIYDTIDDFVNGGTFPTASPGTWQQSPGTNWERESGSDDGAGSGVAGNGLCEGTENCIFTDKITSQMWTKHRSTFSWDNAITDCENLTYGAYTDWRLPTVKELLQASVDGIWSVAAINQLNLTPTNPYWSSTTISNNQPQAWMVTMYSGKMLNVNKTTSSIMICTRN
ncbi:MAG: DUF1566 domain-containing protein [Oligoflexales bacterium]